jgi:hypothetical protein
LALEPVLPSLVDPIVDPALSFGIIVSLPEAELPPVALMLPADAPVEPLVVTPPDALAPPAMLPPIEPPWVSPAAGEPAPAALDVPLAEAEPPCTCAQATPLTAIIAAKEAENINLRMNKSPENKVYLPLPPPAPPEPPPTEPPMPPVAEPAVPVALLSPPPLIVPEVLPSLIEPLVLVVGEVLVVPPIAPPVPSDILFGPEPTVPCVAGAVLAVCASAMPEQLMDRATVKARSLRDMRIS